MYQPALGSFTARDPLPKMNEADLLYDNIDPFSIGSSGDFYEYAKCNPIKFNDPVGLEPGLPEPLGITPFWFNSSNEPPHQIAGKKEGIQGPLKEGMTRTIKRYTPCKGFDNIGVLCDQPQKYQEGRWLSVDNFFAGWRNDGPQCNCKPCPTQNTISGSTVVIYGCFTSTVYVGERNAADAMIPFDIHLGYSQPKVAFTYAMPDAAEVDKNGCDHIVMIMEKAEEFLRAMGRLNEAQSQRTGIDCVKAVCKQL